MPEPKDPEALPPPATLDEREARVLQDLRVSLLLNDGELPLPDPPRRKPWNEGMNVLDG